VEGDDFNEPIPDAVKGIVDGHLWLSRSLANRDIFRRLMCFKASAGCAAMWRRRTSFARPGESWRCCGYQDIEDLVNIGAYVAGVNLEFDLAVGARPRILKFLQQEATAPMRLEQSTNSWRNCPRGSISWKRRWRPRRRRRRRGRRQSEITIMARFVFKLDGVLRHRANIEQQRRRELAAVEAQMAALEAQLRALDAAVRASETDLRENRLVGRWTWRFSRRTGATRSQCSVRQWVSPRKWPA